MVHTGDAPHVAEDGSFAASTPSLPVLQYYPVRGRAEPIRLVLSYVGRTWFETPAASIRQIEGVMHREFDGYPFRQLPRFIDEGHEGGPPHGEVDLVQSQAIMRHLGRRHGLYGSDLVEAGRIDMILDAVVELRAKIKTVVIDQRLDPGAVAAYAGSVMAPAEELKSSAMMGPGLASLEHILASALYSGAGWAVGPSASIADFALFNLTDLHLDHWSDLVRSRFPALAQHHGRVAALEGVAQYLASESRHPIAWGAEWAGEPK
ncbi:hypothetical protein HYH03_004504 [Edaphochlamys debaryana]|uniref:glutathione transferase n=1 Tax=Edaphochlamys debaryana TaxID=47281 RepID=A0A835Y792_9CHLO|nr:hypothetical protein HYH03_004504 [Edaphochlamys debaryana]|eukprot:KAG2497343.1 hypothetical protein HYH03_004504 [Edaphochlamys debaryana]